MSSPPVEAPDGEVVGILPRRRGPKIYSVHNGVARIAGPTGTASPRPRWRSSPPHPADAAQSTLFEALLLAEIDDLEDRATAVERRRQRRSEPSPDGVDTLPHELKELRLRIAEARRLLEALHARFPPN